MTYYSSYSSWSWGCSSSYTAPSYSYSCYNYTPSYSCYGGYGSYSSSSWSWGSCSYTKSYDCSWKPSYDWSKCYDWTKYFCNPEPPPCDVPNQPPEPVNDAGETCVTDAVTIDVLANDTDPDAGPSPLTITAVNGTAISEGASVDVNGVSVSLIGGKLVFDGHAAADLVALNVGEQSTLSYSYTVSDGTDTASASVDVTFCGSAETVQELCASIPATITYQIADGFAQTPYGDTGYDIKIVTAEGDARFEGVTFDQAYCLNFRLPAETAADFTTAPVLNGAMTCSTDATGVFAANQIGVNGQHAADNLDLINWILNQDFEHNGAGSVDGTFTGWEVQFAIWELTNNVDSALTFNAAPEVGQAADADYIVQQAIANGEGFQAGAGDKIGLIIQPDPVTPDNGQPFIVAVDFNAIDCLC